MPILSTTTTVDNVSTTGARGHLVLPHDDETHIAYEGQLTLDGRLILSPGQLQAVWIARAYKVAADAVRAEQAGDWPLFLRWRASQFLYAVGAELLQLKHPWSMMNDFGRNGLLRQSVIPQLHDRHAFYSRIRQGMQGAERNVVTLVCEQIDGMIDDVQLAASFTWLLDEYRLHDVGDEIRAFAAQEAPTTVNAAREGTDA